MTHQAQGEGSERVEDRIAVVTGAGSGIGRATALRLAADGWRVAAADLDLAGAEATADLDGAGRTAAVAPGAAATPVEPEIRPFAVDVADAGSVAALAIAVGDSLGAPTAVVNCAGWDEGSRFEETDRAFWERVIAINLTGVVAVTHAFLGPLMEAGAGGRIVNVASDAARVGSTGEAVYAGAKGGVIAFTKSLARELARSRITANAVCPGPTDTPLFASFPERLRESLERAIPLGRLGRPEDVAAAIAYFASPDAEFVTGQVLSVSGGLTMAG